MAKVWLTYDQGMANVLVKTSPKSVNVGQTLVTCWSNVSRQTFDEHENCLLNCMLVIDSLWVVRNDYWFYTSLVLTTALERKINNSVALYILLFLGLFINKKVVIKFYCKILIYQKIKAGSFRNRSFGEKDWHLNKYCNSS